jgi:hypothetical protein
VLELLAHTVAARRSPERAFRILQRVAASAQVVKGPRDEAADAAQRLLGELSQHGRMGI